jgi:hypothetical protein
MKWDLQSRLKHLEKNIGTQNNLEELRKLYSKDLKLKSGEVWKNVPDKDGNNYKVAKIKNKHYNKNWATKPTGKPSEWMEYLYRSPGLEVLMKREATDFVTHTPVKFKGSEAEEKKNEIDELKHFDIDSVEAKGSGRKDVADENNILYQAVLRGVGFVIGPMHDRHKQIVQKLFRSGKIYLVLATDAMGVGANMKVKHLYIPSLTKPPHFTKLDSSSLVQLINRAGRDVESSATVYCSLEDYEDVKRLFEGDPAKEVAPISAVPFGSFKEASKKMSKFNLSNIFMRLL